jgi:ParB family chromosome partitioning protein
MEVVDLPLEALVEAIWNANQMDEATLSKLLVSIRRYGFMENLVVRPLGEGSFEVLSGNQRLRVLQQLEYPSVPCVIVDLDDVHARLLAQALNNLRGKDDLGLKAEVLRDVLEHLSEEEVLAVLPETSASLSDLATLGQHSMAEALKHWQQAQAARLRHFQAQLTQAEQDVVERVMSRIIAEVRGEQSENPNVRGRALHRLCQWYEEAHRG